MKQINDYTSRHLTALALALLLVGLLCVPAVSATILYDEEIDDYVFTGESYTVPGASQVASQKPLDRIMIKDISQCNSLSYIVIDCAPAYFVGAYPDGTHNLEYWYISNPSVTYPLTATITTTYDLLGQRTNTRIQLFFPEWDIGSLTGQQTIQFSDSLYTCRAEDPARASRQHNVYAANGDYPDHTFTVSCGQWSKNHITISDNGYDYTINLKRVYGNQYFKSDLVAKLGETIRYSESGSGDLDLKFIHSEIDVVQLSNSLKTRIYPLAGDQTGTSDSVTVYVRNSQTGSLLANANLVISANVDGNFQEVVNETVPSGIYSIDLQPTGGGMPNPDSYRLWVTLDGYNSQMPYIDFEVSGGTSVYVYMEPTGEPPVDENMTFVEFYVRDIYANPLANADVSCGGYTLKTNSAGYTQFELPKNAVYSYSVSKTGYMTIEGIATVESDDRYVVNVALMAGVVPTQTVVTPTITVEPTPTQTTPPIQEDNIIGLSVKGLAKGFGIDYDTALLMFGLMIIFGAGGMVMSSVKGGAMEFIAGSIVGTFVAFALGLIPIWIFIIIAVVFGAYVLRVFVQGSQ